MPDKFLRDGEVYYTREALEKCPTVASGEYVPMLSQDIRVLRPAAHVYGSLTWGLLRHVPIHRVCVTGFVVRKTQRGRFELVDFARSVPVQASEDVCSRLRIGDLCIVYGTIAFQRRQPVVRADGITVEKQHPSHAVMSQWRSVVVSYRRRMLSKHDKQATLEAPPHVRLSLEILGIVLKGFVSHETVKKRCVLRFRDDEYERAVDMLRGQYVVVETEEGLGPFDYLDDLTKYILSEAERSSCVSGDKMHRCFPFLRMSFSTLNHLVFLVLGAHRCHFHPAEGTWKIST